MNPRPTMDLADYVRELTETHSHAEHYQIRRGRTWYGANHVTNVPPLLVQLRYASPSGRGDERGGIGFESRPAASLDSIDTLTLIDARASSWVRELGGNDPLNTADCVRRLHGLAASLNGCSKRKRGCCQRHQIEHDIRRWWTQARVMTGWDSPAWRPDNTCPMCGEHGTLRVKLVDQIALCVECRDTWDETSIGLLAEHIRSESAGVRQAPATTLCWCPWPRPATDAWPSLCPVCASPWCHRAGWERALEESGDTPEHAWVS